MNETTIDVIGMELERKGLSHSEIDDYFEHHGVKGMKWGVRKQRRHDRQLRRIQGRVDRTARIANKTASLTDRALGSAVTAKGAQRQLQRHANAQAKWEAKLAAGKGQRRQKFVEKRGYVKVSEINYHAKGDAKAKMDNGQKAALAFLAVVATARIATAAR